MQNEPNFTPHTPKNPINQPQPKADSKNNQSFILRSSTTENGSIINNQLKGVTTEISEDYEHALLHGYPENEPYPPQKPINQSRPKADSTNNQSSLINNQLKGVIARRNGGRSEAAHYPRRPLKNRIV
jgi:hypothetical protein